MFLMFIPSNDSRIQIDIDLFDLLIFLNTLLNVTISTSLLSAIRFPVIPPGPRIRFTLPFGIRENTLQKHLQNIFLKTNVTSRWELLRLRMQ